MNQQLQTKLHALIQRGQLPSSQCGVRFKEWIMPLLQTGVVREVRTGAGASLSIINANAVQGFYDKAFPNPVLDEALGNRINGVGLFRNSKAIANDTPEIIMARVAEGSPILHDGPLTESVQATQRNGVFAIRLSSRQRPVLQGNWVLIENPAVFHQHHRVFGSATSALLVNGRMSHRVLQWLAEQGTDHLNLLHSPDYDPVGLDEFVRLHNVLGDRIRLYLPADIEQLFARYSSKQLMLLEKQQTLARKLSDHPHPYVQRIVGLISANNAGLEQEALLI